LKLSGTGTGIIVLPTIDEPLKLRTTIGNAKSDVK